MRDPVISPLERVGTAVGDALAPVAPDALSPVLSAPLLLGAVAAFLALAVGAAVLTAAVRSLHRRWRTRRQARRSRSRHERAQSRAPPVDVGDEETAGVREFSTHHSGERHAVCKVEGFVCFVEDVPTAVSEGDVIRFSVLSFNRGETSATATFVGTV